MTLPACDWCYDEIAGDPLTTIDGVHHFCHLGCAKLYYDNVSKDIYYDSATYNRSFVNGKLSNQAREVFMKVGWMQLPQLPNWVLDKSYEETSHMDIRDRYVQGLKLIR